MTVIHGRVFKEQTGAGLTGVLVSDGHSVATTDEDGRYLLRVLGATGANVFVTTPPGYASVGEFYRRVRIPEGGTATLDFGLREAPERAANSFTLAILADTQHDPLNPRLPEQLAEIAAHPACPRFIVHLGDLAIQAATVTQTRYILAEYKEVIARCPLPVYNVFGNHEHAGQVDPRCHSDDEGFGPGAYEEILGPSYYSLDYGPVHFIVLNNFQLEARRWVVEIDPVQLAWLRQDLANQPSHKPIILFYHSPGRLRNHDAVMSVLSDRPVLAAFAGHIHLNQEARRTAGTPFPVITTARPYPNPPTPGGWRLVQVELQTCTEPCPEQSRRGSRSDSVCLTHTYLAFGEDHPLHIRLPTPGSALDGQVELVTTFYHIYSGDACLEYQVDDGPWQAMQPDSRSGRPDPVSQTWRAHWDATRTSWGLHRLAVRAIDRHRRTWKDSIIVRRSPSPVLWTWRLPMGGPSDPLGWSSPALAAADGLLLVQAGDGQLYALDALAGAVQWVYDAGAALVSDRPTVAGGTVYVATVDGYLHAVDLAHGSLRWRHFCGLCLLSAPVVDAGRLYFGGHFPHDPAQDYVFAGRCGALDAATGEELWVWQPPGMVLFTSPATCDDLAFFVADGIYALRAHCGTLVWAYQDARRPMYVSSTAVVEDTLYVTAKDGWLCGLEARTGRLRSRYFVHGLRFTATTERIYVATDFITGGPGLLAVDQRSGVQAWWFRPDAIVTFAAPPTLHDGLLYTGSGNGNLYVLDAHTGKPVWSYYLGHDLAGSPVTLVQGAGACTEPRPVPGRCPEQSRRVSRSDGWDLLCLMAGGTVYAVRVPCPRLLISGNDEVRHAN